jgi:hypothetical protein
MSEQDNKIGEELKLSHSFTSEKQQQGDKSEGGLNQSLNLVSGNQHILIKELREILSSVVDKAALFRVELGEKSEELKKLTGDLEDGVNKISEKLSLKLNNTVQSLNMQSKALTVDDDQTAVVTYVQSTMSAVTIGDSVYDISSIKLNNRLRDSEEQKVALSMRFSSTMNTSNVKRQGLKRRSLSADGSLIVSGFLRDLAAKVDTLDNDTMDMVLLSLEIRDIVIQILRYISYLRLIEDSGLDYAKEARLSVISYHAGKQALGEAITNCSNDEQIAIRREYELINPMTRISDSTVNLGVYSTFSFRQPKGGLSDSITGFYADNMLTSSDMRKYRVIGVGEDQIVISRCGSLTEPMSSPVFDIDVEGATELLNLIKIMDILVLSAAALTDNEGGSYGVETKGLLLTLQDIFGSLKRIEGNNQDTLDKKLGITIKDKGVAYKKGIDAAIDVRDDVKDSNSTKTLLNLQRMMNN